MRRPTVDRGRGLRILALALLTATLASPAFPATTADPFEDCERRLAAEPESREATSCFYEVARRSGAWNDATEHLRRHLAGAPGNPWLHYYLANSLWSSRHPDVVTHYHRAADLLAESGDQEGAAKCWLNLAFFHRLTGRDDAAAEALDRALAAARANGDPMLAATVEIEQARQMLSRGQDFARAYWRLKSIEEVAFPDGPYHLKRDCVMTLGMVAYNLGRWDEVRAYRRRGIELARAEGDRYMEVSMLYGLAAVELADPLPSVDRETLIERYRDVLAEAREAGHRMVETQALRDLGRLVGGQEGRQMLESCESITRELGQDVQLAACLRGLAVLVAEEDPTYAETLLDEALSQALLAGDPWPMVYGWVERLAVRWKTLPRQEALEDSLRALELIEALRELQGTETGRLGVGNVWSEAYYWLSGRLLGSEPTRDELELAFSLAERARARGLLEDLAVPDAEPPPENDEHHRLVQEIVDLNRRLLDPATPPAARGDLLARLDVLESREAALRESSRARAGAPEFAQLDEIENSLADEEALLTFQLSPWQDPYGEPGGGSWLLVATREHTRIYPIPDLAELQTSIDLFLGMINRRDGSDARAAAALGERLLGPALAELPARVSSLIVVPDGPLHQIPFAALRRTHDDDPLMERYRLTTVPSASLWLGWRRWPRPPGREGALVFADPLPAGATSGGSAEGGEATERAWALATGWVPGTLPQARREGRGIARLLGAGTRVLIGDEASEARVKGSLDGFPVLHFAAHALVDGTRPQRSAVLLSPGDGTEDGLLQTWEIVRLDLDDRLVVLSACRGASGAVLQGEGSMSLARAFFLAGARAVIAAPWPLRDDEARQLTEAIYRHLAQGSDLAAALAEAQRELAADGAPAAAWAGLQLHGDGSWVPFLPRPSRSIPPAVLLAVALALLVAAGGALLPWRRARRRSGS